MVRMTATPSARTALRATRIAREGRSAHSGAAGLSSYSHVSVMPWDSATCGGFPTCVSKMAEVTFKRAKLTVLVYSN